MLFKYNELHGILRTHTHKHTVYGTLFRWYCIARWFSHSIENLSLNLLSMSEVVCAMDGEVRSIKLNFSIKLSFPSEWCAHSAHTKQVFDKFTIITAVVRVVRYLMLM